MAVPQFHVTIQAAPQAVASSHTANVVQWPISLVTRGRGAGTTQLKILDNVSGVLQPGRLTLLLGPPSSGKSTLLKALSGRLEHTSLKVGNLHHTAAAWALMLWKALSWCSTSTLHQEYVRLEARLLHQIMSCKPAPHVVPAVAASVPMGPACAQHAKRRAAEAECVAWRSTGAE